MAPRVKLLILFNVLGRIRQEMFAELGDFLCEITGFDSMSLQPNAGAAGEYAGLMVIRAFHDVRSLPSKVVVWCSSSRYARAQWLIVLVCLVWYDNDEEFQLVQSRGDHHRNVCIIPTSAHGTNPASAAMCGMKIVSIGTDAKGNVDISQLRKAAEEHKNDLAALMVTFSALFVTFRRGNLPKSSPSYPLSVQLLVERFWLGLVINVPRTRGILVLFC